MRVVLLAVVLFLFGWGNKALAAIDPVGSVRSALVRGERNVVVPKGVYRVRPDGVDPRVYFRLAGLSDVTVDFSGSDLIGLVRTRFFDLSGCTNVTIRNVSLDFDELPFTQAVIERVDAEHNWDVRVIDGYPCPGAVKGGLGLDSHDDFWPIQVYDGKTLELKNPMRYQGGISIERTGERTYRIVGGVDRRGDVGDIAVWSVQEASLPTLSENVNAFRCKDLVFENVTQYATPHGRAFIDWESANTTYRNCRVVRRPPETDPVKRGLKRLRSGNHDAFISKNAYVGPKLIGCEAEYHCDDCVNISGAYQVGYSCHGDEVRVFVHGTWDLQLDVGDSCQVLTPDGQTPPNVRILAILPGPSVTVEESRYLASIGLWPGIAQGMRKSYVLKLDRDADFPRGTLLASEGRMGNGFLIRDCRFGSTRGRGLLLKASDGCVENCHVMKPVCLTTEYEWLSAGIARNVILRGNVFESGLEKGGTAAKGIRLSNDVNTGIVVEQGNAR